MISARAIFRRPAAARQEKPWSGCSDAELVHAAKCQDRAGKEAFVEIVKRHQNAVCAAAYCLSGSITQAEDAAQETFLRAWKRLGTMREPAKLKAWLVKIAHDCAVDALRRTRPQVPLDEEHAELAGSAARPDESVAAAEEEAMVWSALADLPENLRMPLVMFYREGQSVAAVAAALDLSEDAVKQRLCRGREALRDKVTAKIEGVLGRMNPSALLVVAIAAAIGLTAAPVAMAAGVFAGASAASGTASAAAGQQAGAATFSTAMTASSYLIAAVTMAAFIPLGWQAAQPVPSADPHAAPVVTKPKGPPDPFRNYPDSALLREWQRLHEEHGTDAAAMVKIYEGIAKVQDAFHRRALRSALLAEWAAVDPAGGTSTLVKKKQGDQASNLLREWIRLDAAAAAAHMAVMPKQQQWMAFDNLTEVAKAAPETVPALVASLPGPRSEVHHEVQEAFSILSRKDSAGALEAAEVLTEPNRSEALAGVAKGWAMRDADAAIAWAKALPAGPGRDTALRMAVLGLAETDPLRAMERLDEAPAGGSGMNSEELGEEVLEKFAMKDLNAALRWMEAHPDKLGSRSAEGLGAAVEVRLLNDPAEFLAFFSAQSERGKDMLSEPLGNVMLNDGYARKDEVWAWVKSLPRDQFAEQFQAHLISCAAWTEPQQAMRWLAEFPTDQPLPKLVTGSLTQLLGGVHSPQQLEALLADAPGAFRGQLMAVAVTNGGDQPLEIEDAAFWTKQVAALPFREQEPAVQSLAERLAAGDAPAAADWAEALPLMQQVPAQAGVVRRWAESDPASASEWVRSLENGPGRDAAATQLVKSIAASEPEAAWEWARQIGQGAATPQRLRALHAALANWPDPSALPRMLQSATDAQEREILAEAVRTKVQQTQPAVQPPATPNNK